MLRATRRGRPILAFDPGTHLCGYCLGWADGRVDQLQPERMGTIIAPAGSISIRLGYIKVQIGPLMEWADEHDAEVVTERPIVWGPKAATIQIARVGGVILAEIGARKLRHVEYLPNEWKVVTGSGAASKDMVAHFVRNIFNLTRLPAPDEGDAACMWIHHATRTPQLRSAL